MFTLGRKIDFNYKTNKFITIAAAIVAVIGWISTGNPKSGLMIGVSVFLTWALSRELDPTHDYSAFLGAGFSLLNLVYYENIELLVVFWLLLLIRLVNGITGKDRTMVDVVSVLGLTVYLSLNNKNSGYLVVFVVAMLCLLVVREKVKLAVIAGVIGLGLFIGESFFMDFLVFNKFNDLNWSSLFAILLWGSSLILFWFLSKAEIKDDLGHLVKRSNILAGQTLYSGAILILTLFNAVSFNNLVIYLSVIAGVLIYFVGNLALNQPRVK